LPEQVRKTQSVSDRILCILLLLMPSRLYIAFYLFCIYGRHGQEKSSIAHIFCICNLPPAGKTPHGFPVLAAGAIQ